MDNSYVSQTKEALAESIDNDDTRMGYGLHKKSVILIAKSMWSLEEAVSKASASGEKLQNRMFWLTVAIAAATVVGAVATAIMAFK